MENTGLYPAGREIGSTCEEVGGKGNRERRKPGEVGHRNQGERKCVML